MMASPPPKPVTRPAGRNCQAWAVEAGQVHGQGHPGDAEHHDHEPDAEDGPAEAGHEHGSAEHGGDRHPDRVRTAGEGGPQRAVAEHGLGEHVEHQREADHRAEAEHDHGDAADVAAVAQQGRGDQRGAAPLLVPGEDREHHQCADDQRHRPPRPAEGATFHQRVDQGQRTDGQQGDAERVEAQARLAAGGRDEPDRRDGGQRARWAG